MIDTRNTEGKKMEPFPTDRRYKIAYVSHDLLTNFLTTSISTGLRYAKIASEALIPEGAKVAHVSYDFSRQCLAVILHHESFDEVPLGVEIPAVCNGLIEYQIVKVVCQPDDRADDNREWIGKFGYRFCWKCFPEMENDCDVEIISEDTREG
jgi:hypothetical protein